MEKTIRTHTSVGITLIAAFYLFGALVLLAGLLFNPAGVGRTIADAHGLPAAADGVILSLIAVLAALMAYGLFTRARWGYFLTVAYLALFGAVSLWMMSQSFQQPYIGNSTWAVLALAYLVWKRKAFL